MPARTGHDKKEKEGRLAFVGQLSLMLAVFTDRFVSGKRNQHQADQLKRAIQLARDGRLLAVVEKPKVLDEEGLQTTLSLEVSEIGLRRNHVKYLRERGVRYVGEFYLVDFGTHRESLERKREIAGHLQTTFGLSEFVDVRKVWTPPYWNDAFRRTLRRAIDEVVIDTKPLSRWAEMGGLLYHYTRLRYLHLSGIHHAGHFLGRDYKIGSLLKTQKALRGQSGLRAAMMLPADIRHPTCMPTIWTVQLEELRVEHEAEYARRAKEVAKCFEKMLKALRAERFNVWSLPWLASLLEEDLSIRSGNALKELSGYQVSLRMFLQMRPEEITRKRISSRLNRKSLDQIMGALRKIDEGFKYEMTDSEIDALASRLEERFAQA